LQNRYRSSWDMAAFIIVQFWQFEGLSHIEGTLTVLDGARPECSCLAMASTSTGLIAPARIDQARLNNKTCSAKCVYFRLVQYDGAVHQTSFSLSQSFLDGIRLRATKDQRHPVHESRMYLFTPDDTTFRVTETPAW